MIWEQYTLYIWHTERVFKFLADTVYFVPKVWIAEDRCFFQIISFSWYQNLQQ